jgi:hypothetical protein
MLQAFQARTALAPEQGLRYCFQPGAAPLWPSASHVPSAADIPPCPHCGAQRRFEFQVGRDLNHIVSPLFMEGKVMSVCVGHMRARA